MAVFWSVTRVIVHKRDIWAAIRLATPCDVVMLAVQPTSDASVATTAKDIRQGHWRGVRFGVQEPGLKLRDSLN